jgi:hypothetical protein
MAQIGQWIEKSRVRLENEHVVLTPVEEKDRGGWRAQALDPDIWTHFVTRVDDDADFELLFEEINRTKSGRHFFNPGAIL